MKKLFLTAAIVLALGMTSFANPNNGGLFQRGATEDNGMYSNREGEGLVRFPGLPNHGENGDQPAPLGTGIAVLTALGAAYLIGKKRREE